MKLRTVAPAATVALAALALLAGCKKGDSNANNTNSTASKNTTITANTTTNTAPSPLGTPTSTASASTPTEAFRLFIEALKRNDPAAVKSLFSRSTINMMEEEAKREKKSFNDVFNDGFEDARKDAQTADYESRNEKIDGDRATLEVNNSKQGGWKTLHFVNEGGWKISFADEGRAGDSDGGGDDHDGH
jgi:hypothetical protein